MINKVSSAVAALQRWTDEGHQIGWQLYASIEGEVVADLAGGLAQPGVEMGTDTLMVWFSATKAVTSVAAAQQWERGKFDLDAPVAQYIPEFGTKGKDRITIRQLFTHTAGIRHVDLDRGGNLLPTPGGFSPFVSSWDERFQRIVDGEIEAGWEPGQKAGYHPFSGMFLLAELVQRLDGRPFPQYVREEIFLPLGMDDCWVGMPSETFADYGNRIGVLHICRPEQSPIAFPRVDSEEGCTTCVPGGAGRGPMNQFGRFYEAMLGKGARGDVRILSTTAAEAMVARHRVGMHDETFGIVIDWGLGFIIDSINYGHHSSPRTFGHGGGQSSVAFADPQHQLAVALVMNGLPGPQVHYKRLDEISSNIYEDLGLAAPGSSGRQHEVPKSGLQ